MNLRGTSRSAHADRQAEGSGSAAKPPSAKAFAQCALRMSAIRRKKVAKPSSIRAFALRERCLLSVPSVFAVVDAFALCA